MGKFLFAFGTVAFLLATGADARPKKDDTEEVGDPHRVICRSEIDTGSRLAKSKRCHTAAEWALIKRENRLTIDRVQANKPYQQ